MDEPFTKIARDVHAAADEDGVWLFDEPVSEPSFVDYVGPARCKWDEVPQLITWLVQQWAQHSNTRKETGH